MAEERMLIVNFRKAAERGPRYKRARYAMKFLEQYVKRHMKAKEVKVSQDINMAVFANGSKNPPIRIRVACSKDDKGVVSVKPVKITGKR
ncbi:MAG: 60S ribosomal protein L31 [Candidatus Parvarchaeota archaeon]|nr:60S ribosomal protein L31 [Candidatus Parvarchaeota archaeon]MCW1301631.1 60S ribosomal protein L31 [Candidatus Parvarchaeota archaeon]